MTERNIDDTKPIAASMNRGGNLLLILLAAAAGILASALILPIWAPSLAYSLSEPDPKFYWYLSRSTAIVGFCLLWISMIMGLLLTSKAARTFPGMKIAREWHQDVTLVGMATVLFHAMILIGDAYIQFTLPTVLIPFSNPEYRPAWVGIGQIAFYTWVIVILSYYVRERIGFKTWRAIHFVTFLTFLMALVHGITSGTDTETTAMQIIYWGSGISVFFLTIYRILVSQKRD